VKSITYKTCRGIYYSNIIIKNSSTEKLEISYHPQDYNTQKWGTTNPNPSQSPQARTLQAAVEAQPVIIQA